jgi:hypothetical protein
MPSLTQKQRATSIALTVTAVIGIAFYVNDSTESVVPKHKDILSSETSPKRAAPQFKPKDAKPVHLSKPELATATQLPESSTTENNEDSVSLYDYILKHFRTVGDIRPGAEARYQASLRQLRNNPEAVSDLVHLFEQTGRMQWNRQWLIVETLGEIAPVSGVEVFVSVLNRPSVVTTAPHGLPNLERMIQFSAVDHLVRASAQGSTSAQKALDELQEHPESELISYLQKAQKG